MSQVHAEWPPNKSVPPSRLNKQTCSCKITRTAWLVQEVSHAYMDLVASCDMYSYSDVELKTAGG